MASQIHPLLISAANRYNFPINPAVGGSPLREIRKIASATARNGALEPSPL